VRWCSWGIAYASGPYYNLMWDRLTPPALVKMVATCHAAAQKALALIDKADPAERALIEAIQARYPQSTPVEDCSIWNDDYASAMRKVYQNYGDDLDIAALFAESLMDRTPWKLWDLATAAPAEGADTAEAIEVLERAFENPASYVHPGVLHMYIHLMEMSPFPERALRAGDSLRNLVPDSGHLRHMATHIDVLCGHYHDVIDSNTAAVAADNKYLDRTSRMSLNTFSLLHNLHFKTYGAMFLGQKEVALQAADDLVASLPRQLLEMTEPYNMADRVEWWVSMKQHAMIRFGMWQEIIDTPLPDDQQLYAVTTAVTHYAKGVAFAATGRIAEAEEQQRLFEAAVSRLPATRYNGLANKSTDVLAIAREMLAGELEYRKGNYDDAFAHLRESIALYDGLAYAEPWAWMQPVRHAYGALLLEQGRLEEAEAVYRADLGLDDSLARPHQHPENVWSLHGYHECLMRLGKHQFCGIIKQRLDIAAARADVPIESSCFCRLEHVA
jgi:tetratricopeptide (TPR) repeat protein